MEGFIKIDEGIYQTDFLTLDMIRELRRHGFKVIIVADDVAYIVEKEIPRIEGEKTIYVVHSSVYNRFIEKLPAKLKFFY
ncbi:MAG: hypothetical protein DRO40_09985 [Thermoprotei archaeon]|nr:MAG: hypothetical protein DRO40_09985 [Thermoprotei archaeon]